MSRMWRLIGGVAKTFVYRQEDAAKNMKVKCAGLAAHDQ